MHGHVDTTRDTTVDALIGYLSPPLIIQPWPSAPPTGLAKYCFEITNSFSRTVVLSNKATRDNSGHLV